MASGKRKKRKRVYFTAPIVAVFVVVLAVLSTNAVQPAAWPSAVEGKGASRVSESTPPSAEDAGEGDGAPIDAELAQRIELGDDPVSFEPGYVLVSLAEGATANRVLQACSAYPQLSGCSVAEVIDDFVRLELPGTVSVHDAVGLLAKADAVKSAQPNYRYYALDDGTARSQDAPSGAASAATSPKVSTEISTAAPATSTALSAEALSRSQEALAGVSLSGAAHDALESQSATNDPYIDSQWYITEIKADKVWKSNEFSRERTTTVAVIDAGFLVSHEDLAGNIATSYDAVTQKEGVYPDNITSSEVSHGTHCAGIISATTGNGKGIAGVSNNSCKVLPVRVQDARGRIYTSYVARAYSYLASKRSTYNIRVANVSLGSNSHSRVTRSTDKVLYDAIQKGRDKGIVSVAAACNDDVEAPPYYAFPSDFDNVVSVIALKKTTANKEGVARASYSNYNVSGQMAKNISAPGTNILSLWGTQNHYSDKWYGTMYGSMSGTSMAAPVVAGVLGVMFAANPKLTASEAVSKLYSTANDLTKSRGTKAGWDRATGFGEVNAYKAVSASRPYLSGSAWVKVGKSKKLTVKVGGVKQSSSRWKWKSSNKSIATVNAHGTVKGKKAGRAIITAKKGSKKAVQLVIVRKAKGM